MGQGLCSCDCFDSITEKNLEIDVPRDPESSLIKQSQEDIEGFEYQKIKSEFKAVENQFKSLVLEGVNNYDLITDKDNCKVYSREATDGYVLKYIWTLPYPSQKFIEFMDQIDLRKTWDSNIDVVELIGNYSQTEAIVYTKYKKFLTFDPRETLAYTKSTKVLGNHADITFSVESDKHSVGKGVIRVKLFVAGMYVENINANDQGHVTQVTCISHMDVGLPKNLNNIARKFAGTTIPPLTKKIATQLKKYLEGKEG